MKTLYSLLLLQLILINSHIVRGQHIISGQIVNATTSEHVSFASISMKNSLNGYVANEKGEFTIDISDKSDSLFISSLGYETSSVAITDISALKSPVLIKLKTKNIDLEEIIIISPQVIIKKVIERVPINYYQDFFL